MNRFDSLSEKVTSGAASPDEIRDYAEELYCRGVFLIEKGELDDGVNALYESYMMGNEKAGNYIRENYSSRNKCVRWMDIAMELGSAEAKYDLANAYEKGTGVDVDEALAFRLYTECAEAGNTDAIYRLGAYYESRHQTSQALELYERAEQNGHVTAKARANAMRAAIGKAKKLLADAQNGDAKSQFLYGQCCEEGKGVEKNMNLAFFWYFKAAQAGNVKAQYKVGQCFEAGIGTAQNTDSAIEWYTRATRSEKPYSVAFFRLYELFTEGRIVKADPAYAQRCLVDSADYGYTVAALMVARYYETGTGGFERSIPESAKYYLKAAECNNAEAKAYVDEMLKNADEGDPEAQFFAWAYFSRKERLKRSERALSYLDKSANAGYPPAMAELGMHVPAENAKIIPPSPIPPHTACLTDDEKLRIAELETKAAAGDAEASYELGCIYDTAAVRERNDKDFFEKAVTYFRAGADCGHPASQFKLAQAISSGHGIEQNYEEALALFRKAYENGEIRALTSIGLFYLRGRSVDTDKARALGCFEKAAETGDPEALYRLGKYYGSHGVDEKSTYAFELCMKAAEKGHAKAGLYVGTCYEAGKGTEQDMEKALFWYRKASEQGLTTADYAIAVCYEKGKGVERDGKRAFEIYYSAAIRDNTSAQFRVACMLEHGVGTEENAYEAFRWYYVAAEKGNYKALHALANCYEFGIGVQKDMDTAVLYYMQAADHGNSWSQYRLSVYYTSGLYTERNTEQALRYCKLAAENKSAYAQYRLGRWYEKGFIVEQDMRKAVTYYRLAADQGNPAAQCALAICLEEGNGVQKNITEAISLYGRSAHMNYAPALFRLGLCCETGYGIELDLSDALGYYERAAVLGYPAAVEKITQLLI